MSPQGSDPRSPEANFRSADSPAAKGSYRFWRTLVRAWVRLLSRKIRLLTARDVPVSGPVILLVSHPAGFLDALILVASFERSLRCLLDENLLAGFWQRWLGRRLGMIPCAPGQARWPATLPTVYDALRNHEAVAVFAGRPGAESGGVQALAHAGALIALEAEARNAGAVVLPVHVFLSVAGSGMKEVLIYADSPVDPRRHLHSAGGEARAAGQSLEEALHAALARNCFGMGSDDVDEFLKDLEEVLRTDLAAEWAENPDWKQQVDGFTLSGVVSRWIEQMNSLDPARLVVLRDDLDRYREQRRRGALQQFELEAAGGWLKSSLRRGWCWLESALGLPLAVYGLLNHLPAWVLFFWAGLLKRREEESPAGLWVKRVVILLACYTVQIALCSHWLGRETSGYYVLTLPLSGAYLLRYEWLLRKRTRLLWFALRSPRRKASLRRYRQQVIAQLDQAREGLAEALKIP